MKTEVHDWSCCCWRESDGRGEAGTPRTPPARTLEVIEPPRPSKTRSEPQQTSVSGRA